MKQENFLSDFNIAPFSLLHLLSIESYSGECAEMRFYIEEYINSLQENQSECYFETKTDEFGNIFITKDTVRNSDGLLIKWYKLPERDKTYPCIVAHIDTVHEISGDGIVPIQIGDKITGINPKTMRQTGIGGDDKCGIYAALKSLERLPNCKIAFFVDEEVGCHGSINANTEFFHDCRFILQADRRGNSDFVNNINGPISSREFQRDVLPIIQKYGYSFCSGMMTDVEALSDNAVGISCANISAGYYNPHMDYEYISLSDLNRVVDLILDICQNLEDCYPFDFSERMIYKENLRIERAKSQKLSKVVPIPICEDKYPYKNENEEGYWSNFDETCDSERKLRKELEEFYGNGSDLDFYPGFNKSAR